MDSIPPKPLLSSAAVGGGASVSKPPQTSYSEMIYAAITALKEQNGSTKEAIAKYIESTYQNLSPTHSLLLNHHLNRLKTNGSLILVKNCYKIAPSSVAVNSNGNHTPTAKRGRGRPPKTKTPPPIDINIAPPESNFVEPVSNGVAKKRTPGRPSKIEQDDVVSPVVVPFANTSPPHASPARPAPPVTAADVVPPAVSSKRRGRPRKNASVDDDGADNLPAKQSVKPRKKYKTGRSAGRPRKDPAQAPLPEAEVYKDLQRKLEYFQSRVMKAVVVLKPLFTNSSLSGVVEILDELEGLASMDINAPFPTEPSKSGPASSCEI